MDMGRGSGGVNANLLFGTRSPVKAKIDPLLDLDDLSENDQRYVDWLTEYAIKDKPNEVFEAIQTNKDHMSVAPRLQTLYQKLLESLTRDHLRFVIQDAEREVKQRGHRNWTDQIASKTFKKENPTGLNSQYKELHLRSLEDHDKAACGIDLKDFSEKERRGIWQRYSVKRFDLHHCKECDAIREQDYSLYPATNESTEHDVLTDKERKYLKAKMLLNADIQLKQGFEKDLHHTAVPGYGPDNKDQYIQSKLMDIRDSIVYEFLRTGK